MAKQTIVIGNIDGFKNLSVQEKNKITKDVKVVPINTGAWKNAFTSIWKAFSTGKKLTGSNVGFDELKKQFDTPIKNPFSIDSGGNIVMEINISDSLTPSEKKQYIDTVTSKVPAEIRNSVVKVANSSTTPVSQLPRSFQGGDDNLYQVWSNNPDLRKEFPTFEGKGISGNWNMTEWARRYPSDYNERLSKLSTSETTPINQLPQTLPQSASSTITANRDQVRSAYMTYIGREPTEAEYNHHATNQTGLDALNEWAMKQTFEGPSTQTQQTEIVQPQVQDTTTQPVVETKTTVTPGDQTGTATGPMTEYEELTEAQLWEYWQELRENTEGGGIGPKLYEIYNSRPDLQEVYDSSGKAIPGKGADGFTLNHWAMEFGWKENPDLIMYKPENVVRSVYRYPLRGTDPLATGDTYDAGALDWIKAIRDRKFTTIDSVIGAMRHDSGGEWDSLTDAQQTALLIDAYIPAEGLSQIPKFSDFWNEAQGRIEIENRVNTVYGKLMDDYLEGKGIDEKRYIEDWARLAVGDLTDEEMEDLKEGKVTAIELSEKLKAEGREPGEIGEDELLALTDTQKKFRQSLKQATEGYASAGLTYSSLREKDEEGLRENLGIQQAGIQKEAKRLKDAAGRAATRGQEDIEFDIKAKTTEIEERDKPKEIETAVTQRRAEELTKYDLLKSQTEADILKQQEEALKKAGKQGF